MMHMQSNYHDNMFPEADGIDSRHTVTPGARLKASAEMDLSDIESACAIRPTVLNYSSLHS